MIDRGLAIGVFDLFHVGHLRYLLYPRKRCRNLSVLVTRDETVMEKKRRPPVFPEDERLEIIKNLGWIDEVYLLPQSLDDTEASVVLFRSLFIDHVFVGEDWKDSTRWNRLGQRIRISGMDFSWVPRTGHISTSELLTRIRAGIVGL